MRIQLNLITSALLLAGFYPLAAQAALAPVVADSFVATANPAANYGNLPNLNIGGGASSLLGFDLSSLPAGTQATDIAKATMNLWVNRVGIAGSVKFSPVTGAWAESTVTLGTAPTQGAPFAGPVAINRGGNYVQVDVTNLVKQWVTTPSTNLGLIIEPDASANTTAVIFDSKENPSTSHAAYIDIALKGQQGATGPQGPAGTPGAAGSQGPAGGPGATGPQGPAGTPGATGPRGLTGDPALPGATLDNLLADLANGVTDGLQQSGSCDSNPYPRTIDPATNKLSGTPMNPPCPPVVSLACAPGDVPIPKVSKCELVPLSAADQQTVQDRLNQLVGFPDPTGEFFRSSYKLDRQVVNNALQCNTNGSSGFPGYFAYGAGDGYTPWCFIKLGKVITPPAGVSYGLPDISNFRASDQTVPLASPSSLYQPSTPPNYNNGGYPRITLSQLNNPANWACTPITFQSNPRCFKKPTTLLNRLGIPTQ